MFTCCTVLFCVFVFMLSCALKCVKPTPAGKRHQTALLGKRYTVHGVNMALKTQMYEACTELQNLKDTNTQ